MTVSAQTGEQAPDLQLLDENEKRVTLAGVAGGSPLVVLLFGGPNDEAGGRLLREYRDATLLLRQLGVRVCAVARADPSTLAYLRTERGLGFPMLADPDGSQLARWGVTLQQPGLFLLDRNLVVRQRAAGLLAPPATLLTFIRRGGVSARKRITVHLTVGERLKAVASAVSHALRTARPVR